ncbi:NAD(P)/FAD-dependent oxidoreductase [Chryseobacterium indoltheticum]|jgi:NADH dehydrogenase|uniref:NADH:ubiquinone reductase (non-electrogenic) n=1 Tax=Chryseobacterium indoltheticum TaxID=254 RepID=A0A381FIY5_9FLAO|nr:NAD(P)/FAD-dependent oxidoreductase [Chryseobacterium indoltheticum]AZA61160.1 NAD(P)/FAD-dependent oxidoreductase [Chryseobacterium indoltheticum]AZA73187.1 NAD(P)/FAD-dependent oxidoreductase [Chryseobacterium indoltheticum]MDF2831127.1 NAD(P)/FAD-dependent oxidoreductase [Chryseobacterium indoltheticum]SIR37526.1 NADH dehydrogenase [Chryseobacterium indoltheticum]SUX42890.1 NADH dehydrogenase-like protein SAV0941 [Chryseobacterium indoltheticum]
METREKIIIIGGGFAGLQLAKTLNNKNKKVIVLDRVNHHMFQPLFYQVACGRIEPSNISFPFRKIFQQSRNTQFRLTDVKSIDTANNKVITDGAEFTYDKLIIATGCKTNFFGNKDLESKAFGMKNTQEAIGIRNHVLMTFEKLILEKSRSDDGNWNIVIVGSGPTGVELAGAFSEMKKEILPRDYPYMNFDQLQIILVSSTEKPLAVMSPEAQEKSEKYLKELGVKFLSGEIVTDYDGDKVYMKSGKEIPSNNVIWAAGVTGNVVDGFPSENLVRNRYIVDRFNKVKGYENIYAVGDIAYMETPKYPQGHPQVANVAINQAKNLGKNFLRKSKNEWVEYEYKDQGSLATIGKHRAVVDLPFIKFQGLFAWYFWMFLHLMLILSVRNKLAIFFNWMWSYFNKDSSLRLIISPSKKNNTQQ